MKITIYNTQDFEIDYLKKALGNHEVIFKKEPLNRKNAELIKDSLAISVSGETIDESIIKVLLSKGVKYLALRIAGLDSVVIDYALKNGIQIANVPDYSPYAVAEHAAMLLLALNRRLLRANTKVREYDFTLNDLVGTDLNDKTAGIIGLGRTGAVMAKILNGFGCKILGYNRSEKPELQEKYGIAFCSLDELCQKSDIITLHLPLNKHTEYLINQKTINQMKKGVIIINTARGKLINIQDAIEGLVNEKIGGLGLDVYENEKGLFFHNHSNEILKDDFFARLLSFKNVIITGHMAFLTHEALLNIAQATAYSINCWEKGDISPYQINP